MLPKTLASPPLRHDPVSGRTRRVMNLPNALTLVRIFLVPFLVVFLIADERPNYAAVTVFLAAVLTDWLDGQIARQRGQVTTLGKLLDPIADKLLISAALISLVQVGRAPAWIVWVIVGRELAITGMRAIAASQGMIIAAGDIGKMKMLAQVVAVTLLILGWSTPGGWFTALPLGVVVLWVAMILAVISGVVYCVQFLRAAGVNRGRGE